MNFGKEIDNPSKHETKTWLITGAAGFIGMHTSQRLLDRGDRVIGVDNLNDYYDVSLKQARLERLRCHPNFKSYTLNIADRTELANMFEICLPQRVIHLAAQAGVRNSIATPHAYIDSNIQGFINVLEGCRNHAVQHLVYASSSSVYGGNTCLPFDEHQGTDHPISLYAATKKSNELMAHTYSHLFGIPTTGLRFFTVYGPWGRPDMALFLFTKAILDGRKIDIFNNGNMARDFTFVDDVVEGLIRIAEKQATPNPAFNSGRPDPATSNAPYRIFNIGNSAPRPLMDYIRALEQALGRVAQKTYLPLQAGDMPSTAANTDELSAWVDFKPNTTISDGVGKFVDWYRDYYQV